jgi:2,4-dienoyl-CoA reductase-like NADH-dependent reductase (Old Yellow Enzyme family)/thioredoxin reductase
MQYERLFSEGKIGSLTINNRIVLPGLEVGMADFFGAPSRQLTDYFEERAKNGVGLLFTGITRVTDFHGAMSPRQLSMSHDRNIKPFAALVKQIQSHGTKIFCQLHHPGRQNLSAMIGSWTFAQVFGRYIPGFWGPFFKTVPLFDWTLRNIWAPPVSGPSAIPCTHVQQKTRAFTKREITKLIEDFAAAAVRVQQAGADGVELHAAHGYLIQQFLSPRSNQRQDEYGGSLENRMRFMLEMIEQVRHRVGKEFPLSVRLSVDEFYPQFGKTERGLDLEEGVQIAVALEKAGIDVINVSSGNYETFNSWLEPISYETGWRKHLASAVKEKVKIPVIAANVVRHPEDAEQLLAEGVQDFVAVGRALVVDPAWAVKAREGRETEIRRCISCLHCIDTLSINGVKGKPMTCALNPRLGRERETSNLNQNGNGRTVLVVGGGPAGLSAAKVAARRGFRTVLMEEKDAVGGMLLSGCKPPKKEKINWCRDDMEYAARSAGVEIRLNAPADRQSVEALKPFAVLIAVGGDAIKPDVKGVELPHVHTILDILNEKVHIANSTVAVIGGGMTGLETAELLAEQGNRLIIVEKTAELAAGTYHQNLNDVLTRLNRHTPHYLMQHELKEIQPGKIMLVQTTTRKNLEVQADYVVLALGMRSKKNLVRELSGICPNTVVIGDAHHTGRIADAVHAGFDAAISL